MRKALDGLVRQIVRPTVAKYRRSAWLDARVCPEHQPIVVARDDDTTFGIPHSRFNEAWPLRKDTGLEEIPPLNPHHDVRGLLVPGRPWTGGIRHRLRHRSLGAGHRWSGMVARRLVEPRDRSLNPPEWVERVEAPIPGYPVARRRATVTRQRRSRSGLRPASTTPGRSGSPMPTPGWTRPPPSAGPWRFWTTQRWLTCWQGTAPRGSTVQMRRVQRAAVDMFVHPSGQLQQGPAESGSRWWTPWQIGDSCCPCNFLLCSSLRHSCTDTGRRARQAGPAALRRAAAPPLNPPPALLRPIGHRRRRGSRRCAPGRATRRARQAAR